MIIMSSKKELMTVLDKLMETNNILGCAVITRDGLLIAQKLIDNIDAETFAAMSATTFGAAETAISELNKGEVDRVIIESNQSKIISVGAGPHAVLVSLTNPKINLIEANSTEAALKILFIGRRDYLIDFQNNVDAEQNNPFSKNELKSHFLFSILGYPITTPKSYPNGEAICAKVLSSYHQLVKEGIIDSNSKVLISDK